MRLFLIRHGETVDNVAQLYAGSTDSALTSHGFVQATKLASYLVQSKTHLTHVFSSDLQRARKTAESIVEAQNSNLGKAKGKIKLVQLPSIREKDFGSLERCSYVTHRETRRHGANSLPLIDKTDVKYREVESKASLSLRVNSFINGSVIPIMMESLTMKSEPIVAVISHGMTLSALWKALLKRFALFGVTFAPGVQSRKGKENELEHAATWSNTGYLELHIKHHPSKLGAAKTTKGVVTSLTPSPSGKNASSHVMYDWTMQILAVNSTDHLRGLKRTRSGVGSSKHDEAQKPLESFFKKRRVE